jgi:hypothetical protein
MGRRAMAFLKFPNKSQRACGNIPRDSDNQKNTDVRMTQHRFLSPILGLLALACVPLADAGINAWTLTGPDAGAATFVAIHPTNSQIALIWTSRGIYRTSDGAGHWSLVHEQGFTGRNIAFDPTNPDRVLATRGYLLVSNDAGQTFTQLPGSRSDIRQVEFSTDGVVYAATYNGRVFRSTNSGSTWTACAAPWAEDVGSNSFYVDPNPQLDGKHHLFIEILGAGSERGAYRSVDGCETWIQAGLNNPAGPGQLETRIYHFAVKPGDPARVLAATDRGIRLSYDGGNNWTPTNAVKTTWVQFDPHDPDRVTCVTEYGGMLTSDTSGDTWNFGATGPAITGDNQFEFDPVVAGRMIMATYNGPYLSLDAGITMSLRATGLRAAYAGDLSAADDGTVYATFRLGAGGVFRRDPVTQSWAAVNNTGLFQSAGVNNYLMSHVAAAPSNSSRVYAGVFVSSLVQSDDSGTSWGPAAPYFKNNVLVMGDTAVDPDDEDVAYTATTNDGMLKTVDGGASWTEINNGIPLRATVVAAARGSDVVYAVSRDINISQPETVYKSLDGGANWTATAATPITPGNGFFISLAIDPRDPDVLYAAYSLGIYKTTNGGVSWTLMSFPDFPGPMSGGSHVLIDPQFSDTLLVMNVSDAATFVRSVDGGAHWQRISREAQFGYSFTHSLLNPVRPGQIIVGTEGAGMFEYEVATDLDVNITGVASSLAASTNVAGSLDIGNRGPHASSPSHATLTLPAWITPGTPVGCTRTGQVLDCGVPALQVGQTHSIPLALAVSATGGAGSLSATVATHETDTDDSNNSVSKAVSGAELANLALGFAVSRNTLDPGESMTLTMAVTNDGPSISTLTTLDLPIPAGIEVTGYTATQGTCAVTAGTFHCDVGTVPVGISRVVTVDLLAVTPGTRDISAHADGAGTDNGLLHTNHFVLRVLPIGDLSVTLDESADPVTIGEDFSYTVTVKNVSGDAAGAVVPVSVTGTTIFRLVSSSGMTCPTAVPTQVMNCEISSLPAGDTATAVIGATAILPGIATATATATHSGRDTNPGNNTATIGTTLRQVANLSVEVSDSVDPASASVPFQYTVTVRNSGPNNPAVSIAIPVTGANISNAVASYGTCTHNGSIANCTIPQLDNGGSQVITITASSAAPGTATATATASLAGFDPDTANNSATVETVVRAVADIGVTIVDSADPVTAGGVLSYLVTLTTAGPSSGNVHLTVPVTGSTVTGATPSQGGNCTITAGSVTCDFAPMDFSPSTVNISINSATAGTVTATATATFSGTDPVATNNTATATTTVNAPSSSGSSSGGGSGGGGGGSLDWLLAGLLVLLLASRGWPRAPARRRCLPRPRCPP